MEDNTLFKIGDHKCNECKAVNHCATEIAVRYFATHNAAFEELGKCLTELNLQDYITTLITDAIAVTSEGSDKKPDTLTYVVTQSIALGFAMARGAEIIRCRPELSRALSVLLGALHSSTQPSNEHYKENSN